MHREGHRPGANLPALTPHPLGTEGELTPGPDDLRPSVPRERRALAARGFIDDRADGDRSRDRLVETVGVDAQQGLPRVF